MDNNKLLYFKRNTGFTVAPAGSNDYLLLLGEVWWSAAGWLHLLLQLPGQAKQQQHKAGELMICGATSHAFQACVCVCVCVRASAPPGSQDEAATSS